MASANLTTRMKHAIANEALSQEILKRASVTSAPANAAAAQAILATLDESKNEKIAEYCKVAFAGDGKVGVEIAKKLNGMVAVLKAQANGSEVAEIPEVPAQPADFFGDILVSGLPESYSLEADNAGVIGNSIILTFDGILSVADVANAWNVANPSNTVSLLDGSPTSIPDNGEVIQLAGGADAVPAVPGSDTDVAPAKAAMGSESMSEEAHVHAIHALADKAAADEFKSLFNGMVAAIQSI